jgi:hydroxymethylbilane synthase
MTGLTTMLRGGTRASPLARWQTARVAAALRECSGCACEEILITTEGDRRLEQPLPEIGGKGLFTEALESALRRGAIDFAVHSLKDLPVETPDGLVLAAVWQRADARDVVVARSRTPLIALPPGAVVGTSSNRREAQLRTLRPDLTVRPLRGNVDTRVRKALSGAYDAIVIAAAGVERLGLADAVTEYLPLELMLPAPGQGALAIQCRADDRETRTLLAQLDDAHVRATTSAERRFLAALGGGCAAPIAAYGSVSADPEPTLTLTGLVAATDGSRMVRVRGTGRLGDWQGLANRLADEAVAAGARELLS